MRVMSSKVKKSITKDFNLTLDDRYQLNLIYKSYPTELYEIPGCKKYEAPTYKVVATLHDSLESEVHYNVYLFYLNTYSFNPSQSTSPTVHTLNVYHIKEKSTPRLLLTQNITKLGLTNPIIHSILKDQLTKTINHIIKINA